MDTTKTQHQWESFIKLFDEQNKSRPTRIGVFEGEPGNMTDYWLEDGLPLEGIDLDSCGADAPAIEIMLGSAGNPDERAVTHKVANVRLIKIILSASGTSGGLDVEDEKGTTTILRFEN